MLRSGVAILALLIPLAAGCISTETSREAAESPSRAQAAVDREGPLRIATLNMWGVSVLGIDVAKDIDARFDALRVRLARNKPQLDVILLQEMWKDAPRRALLEDEEVRRQFPYRVDGVERFGGTGLVILSRLAFSHDAVHLKFERQGSLLRAHQGDVLSGKGSIAVRVDLVGRALWIATTHLIACYPDEHASECDENDPNGKYRWDQIQELRIFLSKLAGDAPLIVGGDFNFTRASRYYQTMVAPEVAGCIHDDPAAEEPVDARCFGRHSDFEATPRRGLDRISWIDSGEEHAARRRLDYLWVRPASDASQRLIPDNLEPIFEALVDVPGDKPVPLSDHPALMGSFCFAGARC